VRLGKKHTATHHEQRQRLQHLKGTYRDREYLKKPEKQNKAAKRIILSEIPKRNNSVRQ
jgi:hypothetical protein